MHNSLYSWTAFGLDTNLLENTWIGLGLIMLFGAFKVTQQSVTAQFMGGGGAVPDKTTYNIGAGLIFMSKNQLNITANYEWRKKNKFVGHSGSLAIRYEF